MIAERPWSRRRFGLALLGLLLAGCGGEERPVAVVKGDSGSRPRLKGGEEAEIRARQKARRGRTRG
jgi:hypothetical protein